ncbi:hypothetical protein [Deinococcus aquaticus]|uniref:hypothetical protein n=1 Tax=Deinococcus aquaticus TaxID=328692 RepID=UPI003F47C2AA
MKAKLIGMSAYQGTPVSGTLRIYRAGRYEDGQGNAAVRLEEFKWRAGNAGARGTWGDPFNPAVDAYTVVSAAGEPVPVEGLFEEVFSYADGSERRSLYRKNLIATNLTGTEFDYTQPQGVTTYSGSEPITFQAARDLLTAGNTKIQEVDAAILEWADTKVDIAQSAAQAAAAAGLIPTNATSTTLPSGAGNYRIMGGAEVGQVWMRATNGATPERNEKLESLSADRAQALAGADSAAAVVSADENTDQTAKLRSLAFLPKRNIVLPPRQYSLNGQIVFDGLRNRDIEMAGALLYATADWVPVAGADNGLIVLHDCVNVNVWDGTIDGGADRIPLAVTQLDGLTILGGERVHVRGLTTTNTITHGVSAKDLQGYRTTGVSATGWYGHGVIGQRCEWQHHRQNIIKGLGNRGNIGTGNRNNGGIGILGTWSGGSAPGSGGGYGFIVEDCAFSDIPDTASKTEGMHDVHYTRNRVRGYGKDGLKAQPYAGVSAVVDSFSMIGNRLSGIGRWRPDGTSALLVASAIDGEVLGNWTIGANGNVAGEDNGVKLIQFSAGMALCDNVTVERNTLRDHAQSIRADAGGSTANITYRANRSRSSVATTHFLAQAGQTVEGNEFDGVTAIAQGTGAQIGVNVAGDAVRVRRNKFRNLEQGVFANGRNNGEFVGNDFDATVNRKLRVDTATHAIHSNTGLETGLDRLSVNGNVVTGLDTNNVTYRFVRAALTANLSNQSATPAGSATGVLNVVMPYNGQVVGVVAQMQGVLTAGTATARCSIGGVAQGSPNVALSTTATGYTVGSPKTFIAGQTLAAVVTTTADYAAGGVRDMQIDLIVQFS